MGVASDSEASVDVSVEASGGRAGPRHAQDCPKCGARSRGEATACPSCGLAVGRMATYAETRDAAVPEPVRDAWARVTEAWDAAARHDELLQRVVTHNAYAWAAGRYRTRSRDPIARRQLDRLRHAAEATLLASATTRAGAAGKPYRAMVGVLATLIVVITAGLGYLMVVRGQPPASARPIPARLLTPGHPISPSTVK